MRPNPARSLLIVAVLTVVLPLAGGAQEQPQRETVPRSATRFAVDLYHHLKGEKGNLFFSPHSIYTVLALMYSGAAGETAREMKAALHVPLDAKSFEEALAGVQDILNQVQKEGSVELAIANSLWPQHGASPDPGFLRLAGRFLAEVRPVDYRARPEDAREQINAWAEQKTKGIIKELVDWKLHPETHLLLANAIYFKGSWARRFDKAKTTVMPFRLPDASTVDVPMMVLVDRFPLLETRAAQILRLTYEGGDLSMTIVLPRDPQRLPALEKRLTADDVLAWQGALSEQTLSVYLPRFTLTSAFDLVNLNVLKKLGIRRALDVRAEFPGLGMPQGWFSIDRFVHKAFVKVGEQGTEAAAVTVGGCFPAGTPVPTPSGLVPIETMKAGTAVYSFDLPRGVWTVARVTLLRNSPFSGDMITIRLGNESIEATWNQPFLVSRGDDLQARRVPMDMPAGEPVSTVRGRWVEARDIRSGDVLLVKEGGSSTVTGTSRRAMAGAVYHLEIDRLPNYAVGHQGILVHNKGTSEPLSFKADHPFLFFISDLPTRSILFMGRVTNPTGR